MKKIYRLASTLVTCFTFLACNDQNFSNQAVHKEEGSFQTTQQNITKTPQGENAPTTATKKGPDKCPIQGETYRVLIVDLKSGWFAGDGGDFFKSYVSNLCGGKVEVAYFHATKTHVESNVANVPWAQDYITCQTNSLPSSLNEFEPENIIGAIGSTILNRCLFKEFTDLDQLWLLSGDTSDGNDISTSSALWSSFVSSAENFRDTNPRGGFYFGTGLGNATHANTMINTLFPSLFTGNAFSRSGSREGTLPNVPQWQTEYHSNPSSLTPSAHLSPGNFLQNAPIIGGLEGINAYANKQAHPYPCPGDTINQSVTLKPIAKDNCDRVTMAHGQIGQRHVFLDGNVARFYITEPEDYFHVLLKGML